MKLLALAAIGVVVILSQAAAQSDNTCIAYMEADAAYQAVLQDIEAFEKDSPLGTELFGRRDADRRKLEAAAEVRARAYKEVYRGPTSKVPVVMEKLRRLDRIRCRKRFRG